MNITLKDYIDFMQLVCNECPEIAYLEVPVDTMWNSLPKEFTEDSDMADFLGITINGASEIAIERKCSEFRNELEDF